MLFFVICCISYLRVYIILTICSLGTYKKLLLQNGKILLSRLFYPGWVSHLITVKLCVMSFNYIVCDIGQDICPIFFPLRILYSFENLIFLRGYYIPLRILYLLLVAF